MQSFISVKNLVKKYGNFVALKGISFEISHGEIVGLLGPNGAGKSTTLKILAGLLSGTSGNIAIKNENISDAALSEVCSIGVMLENNPLPENIKVGEYLRFRAAMKGIDAKNVRVHTEKLMRQTDLPRSFRNKEIGLLSKGMQQRVGLAEALLGNPNLVILDEPTIGLDPNQIIKFRKLIASQKGKRTFIISSHILPEIETLCDRFIIMNHGSIVANNSIEELREKFFQDKILNITVECDPPIINAFEKEHKNIALHDVFIDIQKNQHQLALRLPRENSGEFLKIVVNEPRWTIKNIAEKTTSLEEIFIKATEQSPIE